MIAPRRKHVFVRDIQLAVAEHYEITLDHMQGREKIQPIARARQVAMYLSRTLARKSLPVIGHLFGRRDHTTIMSAVRTVKTHLQTDAQLAWDVEQIIQRIGLSGSVPAFPMVRAC